MNYKSILRKDEKILHVAKLSGVVVLFPAIIALVLALSKYLLDPELGANYMLIYNIITGMFAAYAMLTLLLIKNTRWVVTNKRMIIQTVAFRVHCRFTELPDITQVSYYQTPFGSKLGYGAVRVIYSDSEDKSKEHYHFLKHIKKPIEFVATLQFAMEVH